MGELSGKDLLENMRRQAEGFGAEFIQTTITAVDVEDEEKSVFTVQGTFEAKAIIVATGSKLFSKHCKRVDCALLIGNLG